LTSNNLASEANKVERKGKPFETKIKKGGREKQWRGDSVLSEFEEGLQAVRFTEPQRYVVLKSPSLSQLT